MAKAGGEILSAMCHKREVTRRTARGRGARQLVPNLSVALIHNKEGVQHVKLLEEAWTRLWPLPLISEKL